MRCFIAAVTLQDLLKIRPVHRRDKVKDIKNWKFVRGGLGFVYESTYDNQITFLLEESQGGYTLKSFEGEKAKLFKYVTDAGDLSRSPVVLDLEETFKAAWKRIGISDSRWTDHRGGPGLMTSMDRIRNPKRKTPWDELWVQYDELMDAHLMAGVINHHDKLDANDAFLLSHGWSDDEVEEEFKLRKRRKDLNNEIAARFLDPDYETKQDEEDRLFEEDQDRQRDVERKDREEIEERLGNLEKYFEILFPGYKNRPDRSREDLITAAVIFRMNLRDRSQLERGRRLPLSDEQWREVSGEWEGEDDNSAKEAFAELLQNFDMTMIQAAVDAALVRNRISSLEGKKKTIPQGQKSNRFKHLEFDDGGADGAPLPAPAPKSNRFKNIEFSSNHESTQPVSVPRSNRFKNLEFDDQRTASVRQAMIRLAFTLPIGSTERRMLLEQI